MALIYKRQNGAYLENSPDDSCCISIISLNGDTGGYIYKGYIVVLNSIISEFDICTYYVTTSYLNTIVLFKYKVTTYVSRYVAALGQFRYVAVVSICSGATLSAYIYRVFTRSYLFPEFFSPVLVVDLMGFTLFIFTNLKASVTFIFRVINFISSNKLRC